MNKKRIIITLVILLHFSVFAHAEIYNIKLPHKDKPGEFASLTGVFDFKLDTPSNEEFVTKGLFSRKSFIKNVNSGAFRNSGGVFNQKVNEFKNLGFTFEAPRDELNSDGSISNVEQQKSEEELFKSSDQDNFEFSLPKEKEQIK